MCVCFVGGGGESYFPPHKEHIFSPQTVSTERRFVENMGPMEMYALAISCHGDAWRVQGFCSFEGSAEVREKKQYSLLGEGGRGVLIFFLP